MLSPVPLLIIVVVALIFGSFYFWARRQGLLATEPAAEGEQGRRRISLLTEAVAYIGAVLLLAGGIADVGGLLVIVALLAMWLGMVRYTGELDATAGTAEGSAS